MDFELEDDNPEEKREVKSNTATQHKTSVENQALSSRGNSRKKTNKVFWKRLRWLSRASLYLGLALYIYGSYVSNKFDAKLQIDPKVRRNPMQIDAPQDPFDFSYRGNNYEVEPVADYEIGGLVVTHNDISSIMDSYHDSDSVDFRDICLVWGVNVSSNIFRRAKFFSMPWSCHVKFDDDLAADSFVPEQISNNHLLTDNDAVRKRILSMRVGDQVFLKGKLINYWPKGKPAYTRNTSTIRTDTGNGACEVLWVEEAKILRRADSKWDTARRIGIWLLFGAVALGAYIFFAAPLGS